MFEGLSTRLSGILDRLNGRGALSEADVQEAMREVRRALLEADVALEVVRSFTDKVRERAVGAEVIRSVTPGQMVVKIVHDTLVDTLGTEGVAISIGANPPVPIMMVGLQGSGKTTTTAKLAKRLFEKQRKKVLMASLDTRRPAAMEQLAVLGRQIGVDTLPIVAGQSPVQIARRAIEAARLGGYDVVILDTAGRTHVDEALMLEVAEVEKVARPHETLLVVDSLTGQDAVNVARSFTGRVNVTGVVLTRVDGDGRGGAALSMRAVTGKPIKLLGTSEKMDGLEEFHPSRVANRILGMGDIVSLVEKAAETIDAEKGMAIARRMQAGQFTLDDLGEQLDQMLKIGGMQGLMGMLPGVKNMQKQLAGAMDDRTIRRQRAIIQSMTPWERRNPKEIDGKRRRRIAQGSGTQREDVNKLLKMHRTMADMMKSMGGAKRGPMAGLANMFGLGGGMPQPTPEMLAELQSKMPGGLPGKMPALPPGGLPPGFPGLGGLGGGKLPGLPGFPFGKKK